MYTDANKSLTTLVVKHYNDFLGSQTSERGRDEVIFFYVGDLFCIYVYTPWHYVCQFSRKNLRGDFWEKVPNFSLKETYQITKTTLINVFATSRFPKWYGTWLIKHIT